MSARRIGVIVIGTGAYYDAFFGDLVASIRQSFCVDDQVVVFCFSDREEVDGPGLRHIRCKTQPWPFSTLLRFHLICSAADELGEFDTLVYMDCDMRVVRPVHRADISAPLFAVTHPDFPQKAHLAPFEADREYVAYVPEHLRRLYVQGCFFGGLSAPFLQLARDLREATNEGLRKGQIPVFADESYLNWYLASRPFVALDPRFAHPEKWGGEPLIIHRAKDYAALGVGGDEVTFDPAMPSPDALWRHVYLRTAQKAHRLDRQLNRLQARRSPRTSWLARLRAFKGSH